MSDNAIPLLWFSTRVLSFFSSIFIWLHAASATQNGKEKSRLCGGWRWKINKKNVSTPSKPPTTSRAAQCFFYCYQQHRDSGVMLYEVIKLAALHKFTVANVFVSYRANSFDSVTCKINEWKCVADHSTYAFSSVGAAAHVYSQYLFLILRPTVGSAVSLSGLSN